MAVKHALRILFAVVAIFAMASFTGCGNDSSNPASPTIDTAPPAVPSGTSAWGQIGHSNAIHLSWDANVTDADLAGYVLYRAESPNAGYRMVAGDLVNGNSYTDTNVMPGGTYYYRVSARDASGNESGFSQTISIELSENQRDFIASQEPVE